MICPNCEKSIDNNLEVCPYCGCRLAISESIQRERELEEQRRLAAQKEAERQGKLEAKRKKQEERERRKTQEAEENERLAAQKNAEKQRRLEERRREQKEREIQKAKKAEEQKRIAAKKESERLKKAELREAETKRIEAVRLNCIHNNNETNSLGPNESGRFQRGLKETSSFDGSTVSGFKGRFLFAIPKLSIKDILIKKDDFQGERLLGTLALFFSLLYILCLLIFTSSIFVSVIVFILAIGISICCFNKNNDNRGVLSIIILAVSLLLSIPYYFFYVDNPAAHSGSASVEYIGEVESCFLDFNLYGSYYHRQYVNKDASVRIYPYDDDTKCHLTRAQIKNGKLSFRYIDLTTSTKMGSNLTMSSTESLDRTCKYVAELSGKHKGSIFNRPAKKVSFEFTIENATPRSRPENTIFTFANTISCDGVYHNADWEYDYSQSAMYFDLGDKFNRSFFEISFEYYKLPSDDSQNYKNRSLFTIDTDLRVLEISLGDYLGVSINNGESNYGTAIPTKTETWTRIDLCYDYGRLFINGLSFNVERLNPIGDYGNNIISSVNFASGQCFNGYIRGLVVKSK